MEQNTVRDMKIVSNCFVVSRKFPIFAPAILEKTGGNAHLKLKQLTYYIKKDEQERFK